ncbi:hypothetical protein SYNPS1DRAFT_30714 [Syncephalis pseudoplumigaleata]|uniref:Transmembrane protein n=1 Tax=Syncephalis pseudoplumigaleata TaxID=1712513 RepID=A0A4P9YVS8_9FUNG|nr:hypothetical protein SYNPS1DRAFT_30714 [Syncephalis pseudoplumigaleata]|eukprot:RKP23532.1 hypothetical protein SYNPS1DRAFT_30714 [Syncephalis pseudoplumigaleata]
MFHWLFIALALCGGLQHSPAPGWGVSAHFDSTSLHLSPGPALVKRQPQDSPSLLPQPPAVAPESAVVSNSAAVATEPPSTEVEASSAMNTLQSQTATATAIATTAETVSATATAATPTTATATPLPTTAGVTKGDIIVVSCFFVLIFVSIVGTLLYFYITDRFKEPEVVLLERMQTQREVENLVENLHAQLRTLRSMPYSWSNMKPFRVHHLISWCFVAGIIMAFGILLAGLLKGSLSGSFYNTTHANTTSTHREWSAQKSNTPPLVYPLESPSNTQDWAWTPPPLLVYRPPLVSTAPSYAGRIQHQNPPTLYARLTFRPTGKPAKKL